MFPNNSKVCRICLLGSSKGIISLFTVCNGLFKICNKIMEVTDIEIHEEDDLPKWICYSCLVHLETSYQFKLQAEKSDKLLKQQIALEQNGMLQEYTSEDIQLRRQCIEDNKNELKITNVISQASRTDSRSFTPQGAINIRGLCRCKGGTGPLCDACTMITTSNLTQQELVTVVNNTSLLPVCTCAGDDNLKCAVCMASMVKTSMDNILVKIGGQTEFINVALATENDAALETEFIDVNVPDDIIMCTCSSESDVKCEACLKLADISNENMTVEEITVSQSDTEFIDVEESSSKDKVTYPEPEFVDVNAPCDVSVCTCSPDSSVKCDACLKISSETRTSAELVKEERIAEIQYRTITTLNSTALVKSDDLNSSSDEETDDIDKLMPKIKVKAAVTRYKCTTCGKGYRHQSRLAIHMQCHSEKEQPKSCGEHKCPVCDQGFQYKSHLNVHLESHGEVRPYKCDVCAKTFRTELHLSNHKLRHLEVTPYKCTECDRAFKSKIHLSNHKGSAHSKQTVICEICGTFFKLNSALAAHKARRHAEQPGVQCDECGKSFKMMIDLTRHKRNHKAIPVTCNICNKVYAHQTGLLRHQREAHTNKEKISCSICKKLLKSKSVLRNHMKYKHSKLGKVDCHICNLTLSSKTVLGTHMKLKHKVIKSVATDQTSNPV